MTLLAHWPIDDGYYDGPTVTRDIAGGGSGAHDGIPQALGSSYSYGNYRPGGVGGHHLHKRGSNYSGTVRSLANSTDFQLLGAMAVSGWIAHDDTYYSWSYSRRHLAGYTGTNDGTEANNNLWLFSTETDRQLRFAWRYGAAVLVEVLSGGAPLSVNGWTHIGADRYEVTSGKYGVKFYVNGALFSTQDNGGAGWDPPSGGSADQMNLACTIDDDGGHEFNYDSIRVYDTDVGATQMLADFNADIAAGHPGSAGQGGAVKTDNPLGFQDGLYNVGDVSLAYAAIPSGPNSFAERAGWTEE